MKEIRKSIFYKSEKRTLLLTFMLSFVVFSLFLMFSLEFSKFRIEDRLDSLNLTQTIFFTEPVSIHNQSPEDSTEKWIAKYSKEKGYRLETVPFVPTKDLEIESHIGDNYPVLEGKPLDKLEDLEIAVSKEYALTLGKEPLNTTIEAYGETLKVVSIVEYPNYELNYQPLETLNDVGLFSENAKGKAISNNDTVILLSSKMFGAISPDDFDDVPVYSQLKVYYDSYSLSKEEELVNYISSHAKRLPVYFQDSVYRIDSLKTLTRSNPLPLMLKSTISKFVVSSIVLSSLYAFYIHLKNELHDKSKTLATLHLVGISKREIIKTYLSYFLKIFIASLIATFTITTVLSFISDTYRFNLRITLFTILASFVFLVLVFGIFLFNLSKILKNSHTSVKSGQLSYIKTGKFTQSRLILSMALKRITRTVGLTIGFAFSVALSIAVVLVSLSSLSSISNVFHEKTLGLHFDYLIENASVDVFLEFKESAYDVAKVEKDNNVYFLDYSINNPVDDVTMGSIITLYDEIEPFVEVDLGQYPPHHSTFYAEKAPDLYAQVHLLSSKRLMDKNELYIMDDPRGPVDKHYLFMKDYLNSFEEALPIRGSFSTLLDRGYVGLLYRKAPMDSIKSDKSQVHSFIMNLDDTTNKTEFEAKLIEQDIEFIKYDDVLKEFKASNERLNKDTYEILSLIVIAMLIQALVNISGVMVNVKRYRNEEDTFYRRIGIRNKTLRKVNQIDVMLRFMLSFIFVMIFTAILLPLVNDGLKLSFAISYLPSSLFIEIIVSSIVLVVLMLNSILVVSKYKKEV